ncbi:LpqB family beta-propeller domain-containing protein [Paraglaciecola sp. 20A4]|uniref:LpqB family beta-propeller domain-containing protein n=1 Tax=Paraglaciecola sp. 20A4 TaxID=2687288 RepID=UPI00140B7C66|nr:LpqB family beta-propeller domain-containing protein [Paraglaciecola sp. 20A4]
MKQILSKAILAGLLLINANAAWAKEQSKPQIHYKNLTVNQGTAMSVSVSPDGKWLAIDLQGSLWTLSSEGGEATKITDVFDDAHQPTWSPDGKTLAYFAFIDGGYDLWSIEPDGSNRQQLTWGPYDDREPVWSPDGSKIAFASDRKGTYTSYNIWTLNMASGELTAITDDIYENRMPTWSANGKEITYTSMRDKQYGLWSTDIRDLNEKLILTDTAVINNPSWSPSGKLAYSRSNGHKMQLLIDQKIVSGEDDVFPFQPSWTKNGQYYYVAEGEIKRGQLTSKSISTIPFSAKLKSGKEEYVRSVRDFSSAEENAAVGVVRPALSPDGKKVAFVALGNLYLMTIGQEPENLTDDHYMQADPSWSPDGKYLVYSSDQGGDMMQLWTREIATGKERQLTNITTQPLEATWSPDGKRIAYLNVDGMWGVAGLAVVDVASGKITTLTPSLKQPGKPTWSADSKRVAIAGTSSFSHSFREGTNQVYVVAADGSQSDKWYSPELNMSIDTRGGAGPVWSPDGKKMAAIYGGTLHVWPVSLEGKPLGPPRSITNEIAHSPSWAGDSTTMLFQSEDKLKTVNVLSGEISTIEMPLTYKMDKPDERLVVHVGGLFDGENDRIQKNVDIIIDGNLITEIVPHNPQNHKASKFYDASNLVAMPGMIESHVHPQKDLGQSAHRAWLAYGVTTVRDLGNQPYHGVEDREASEAGVRVGPRIYTTGHLMEWQRVYYKMGIAISGPAHLEKELGRAKALKYDHLKSYVRLPDAQQKKVVGFAHHDMGVPVSSHEVYPSSAIGVDNIEHLGATSRRGYSLKHIHGHAFDDATQLIDKVITPTIFGAINGYLVRNPELVNDPRLSLYPSWAQKGIKHPREFPAEYQASLKKMATTLKALFDKGTTITAGTDLVMALNLHAEIDFYVTEAGLTPFQALRSATAVPAKTLGLNAGTLEAGKLADIVFLEASPLDDIANTTKVNMTMINGHLLSQSQLLDKQVPIDVFN